MASDVSSYHLWSKEQLIHQELSHRRAIASYFTGLTLTAATGVATFGVAVPIVVPIAGFKAYKIHSDHKKLKAIRNELTSRSLSSNEKKKRDILIPATTTAAIYLASMGIADVFDVVPDAIQTVIHEPIREGLSLTVNIFNKSILSFSMYLLIVCNLCY